MTRNLDITLMRTFIVVAKSASMTVATNALHLTQDVINQQIRRLEDAFGCRLFERDGRRLELAHTGERFLDRVKHPFAFDGEVWADMATRPLQGPVRLGVPCDLVGTVFPPIFKAFTRA